MDGILVRPLVSLRAEVVRIKVIHVAREDFESALACFQSLSGRPLPNWVRDELKEIGRILRLIEGR